MIDGAICLGPNCLGQIKIVSNAETAKKNHTKIVMKRMVDRKE
jgi:hypothetical protein